MSIPNAASRTLEAYRANRSDLTDSAIRAVLEILQATSVVSDSSTPIADVLAYIDANVTPSFFTQSLKARLNSALTREKRTPYLS